MKEAKYPKWGIGGEKKLAWQEKKWASKLHDPNSKFGRAKFWFPYDAATKICAWKKAWIECICTLKALPLSLFVQCRCLFPCFKKWGKWLSIAWIGSEMQLLSRTERERNISQQSIFVLEQTPSFVLCTSRVYAHVVCCCLLNSSHMCLFFPLFERLRAELAYEKESYLVLQDVLCVWCYRNELRMMRISYFWNEREFRDNPKWGPCFEWAAYDTTKFLCSILNKHRKSNYEHTKNYG